MASSWRVCYNWIFIGWKSVRCFFKLQYRCSAFSYEPIRNKVCFPIAKYAWITRCWCQKWTIRSSTCRCSRLKILCVLGYVVARKHNTATLISRRSEVETVSDAMTYQTGIFIGSEVKTVRTHQQIFPCFTFKNIETLCMEGGMGVSAYASHRYSNAKP